MSVFKKFSKFYDLIPTAILTILFAVITINAPKWMGVLGVLANEKGPDFFPRLICNSGLLLIALLLITQFFLYREKGYIMEVPVQDEESTPWKFLATLAILIFYVSVLPVFGFLVNTMCLIPVLLLIVDIRDWKKMSLYSIGALIVAYLFFIRLLHVTLPRGSGIFRSISMFFY